MVLVYCQYSLVPIPPFLTWERDQIVASFPGPAQLFIACSTVLIATESWAGPGNEANQIALLCAYLAPVDSRLGCMGGVLILWFTQMTELQGMKLQCVP